MVAAEDKRFKEMETDFFFFLKDKLGMRENENSKIYVNPLGVLWKSL